MPASRDPGSTLAGCRARFAGIKGPRGGLRLLAGRRQTGVEMVQRRGESWPGRVEAAAGQGLVASPVGSPGRRARVRRLLCVSRSPPACSPLSQRLTSAAFNPSGQVPSAVFISMAFQDRGEGHKDSTKPETGSSEPSSSGPGAGLCLGLLSPVLARIPSQLRKNPWCLMTFAVRPNYSSSPPISYPPGLPSARILVSLPENSP